jgi:hypothetical protein
VAYDVDPEGNKGAERLGRLSPRMQRIRPSVGKDVTAVWQAGGRVQDWLRRELARRQLLRASGRQLPPGAQVALPDDCYQGVVGLANAGRSRGRWSIRRIAVADTARWIRACAESDLIWLESPSNPLLAVAELGTICAAPRKPGAILGVDNTFATPLNQRPLALGADVAVESVTKFIGGHSDLLGGVVTVRDAARLAARWSGAARRGRDPGRGRSTRVCVHGPPDAAYQAHPPETLRLAGC